MFLTKNDFLVARPCSTKLFYKKLDYPSLLDDDPYLEFLRDGGYMVEAMAKLLFSGARELGHWIEPERAFKETRRALEAGNGTLFEATIIHNKLLARVDILQREQAVLRLIEVKSSSFDSREGPRPFRGKRGGILSDWSEYLEDVTFQTVVLRRAFPELTIVPVLCLVDKAKKATENSTFDKFRLRRADNPENHVKPKVDYLGDINHLQDEHVLAFLDVKAEVDELQVEVTGAADELASTLQSNPILRIAPKIGQKCKGCEYRVLGEAGLQNGFRECWGALADAEPHVLDLYRVDSLGGKKRDEVAEMTATGKAHLHEITDSSLQSAYAPRQRLQIEFSKTNREFISNTLRQNLASHPHPLHFIDFEVSRAAIPYHAGMRPYELSAFQWSCETILGPGTEIVHADWLNVDEAFPNFAFARKLMDHIGDNGTVYIWSPFELAVLREIRRQMTDYSETDPQLAGWLDRMTLRDNPRIVDLCALAKDHYFHPAMKDSLSIKEVLAAAWGTNRSLHAHAAFAKYLKSDEHGRVLAPYAALSPLPIGEKEEVVREGTGAMHVYQEMIFGLAKDDAALRDSYRALLLQYCELDTKAMVFIWMHWSSG